MRKSVLVLGAMLLVFILTGCNKAKDLGDYVDVTFTGLDTQGTASYDVNMEQLFKDVLGYDLSTDFPDEKSANEMNQIAEGFKIKLDKDKNLSNGDKIKLSISVDKNKTDKIIGGEKEFTVEGLEEPLVLTNDEVVKHLVVNFSGVSGRGKAKIDNTLKAPLNYMNFQITQDGELKNGEMASVVIDQELKDQLINNGYVLAEDFGPTFEVKGLQVAAEKATDIANVKDLERMIDEQVKRRYQDILPDSSIGTKYEISLEKLLYRQFHNEVDKENFNAANDNGNFIGVYTIKKSSGGADSQLKDQFTAIIGFSGIYLDDQNRANPAAVKEINRTKDNTYSLESVFQLYEGYGYSEMK